MRQDQPPPVSLPESGKLAGKFLSDPAASEILTLKEAAKLLLDYYSPPGVVINARNEVVHCPTRNYRWLELSTGEPTHDLLKLFREEFAVRSAHGHRSEGLCGNR